MAMELRERDFPFTITRTQGADGDGLNFEGYAAVFNSPAHIEERDGSEFDEVIMPGAFKRSIDRGKPLFMFQHGRHPLIGEMPLGKITELREDSRGLYVKGRLTDNWLISPVRDAIANEAVTGMSVRMQVVKDDWTGPARQQLRTVREVKVFELGPVVGPAYGDTTAMVRTATRTMWETPGIAEAKPGIEERAGMCETEDWSVTQMVEEAVETMLGINDQISDVYTIQDIDGTLTYVVTDATADDQKGIWQVDYTKNADGTIAVSQPRKANLAPTDIPEITVDQPAGRAADLDGEERADDTQSQDSGPSEELASDGPSEELATTRTLDASNPAERRRYVRQLLAERRAS